MINGVTNPVHAATHSTVRSQPPPNEDVRLTEGRVNSSDAVELSEVAREQISRSGSTPIRRELVEQVRAEIAAGKYLTDEKIDAVVNRLHRQVIAAA